MNLLGFQSQVVTEAYRTMVRATWPSTLKVIYPGGLDAGLLREWRARRPDGLLLFRHYFPDEHLDAAKWATTVAAAEQIADLRPILEVPINEAHQTSPEEIARLAEYSVAFVGEAADAGFRAAVGVFSEGNPSDLAWWEQFHPALREARRYGGYLALHEYGVPSLGFEDWHLLRHRRVWDVLPADCRVPILVTECGIDGGIEGRPKTGWRGYYTAPQYRDWLLRYHREIAIAPYVHGATLFLCGGNSDWTSFDITDEVDLRPPLTENLSMPPRWTPQEAPMPDVDFGVPTATSLTQAHGPARPTTVGVFIHSTRSGTPKTLQQEYQGTVNYFMNPDGDSAHVVVGPAEVTRMVHDGDQSYHAQENNRTHLGIEIAQPTIDTPYTARQYELAAAVTRAYCDKYQIPKVRVVSQAVRGIIGHEDSEQGKRYGKSDPGPKFDWPRFISLVQGGSPVADTPEQLQEQVWALGDQLQKIGDRYAAIGYPHRAGFVRAHGEAVKEFVNTASKGQK